LEVPVEVLFKQDVVGFEQVVGSASIWIASSQIRDQMLFTATAVSLNAILDAFILLGEVVKAQ
jgi:hypothetical protein